MGDNVSTPKLNPNQAAVDELARLPGVGQTLARRIEQGRPYKQLDDLRQVAGVGPRLYERLEPRLTLDESPARPRPAAPSVPATLTPKARSERLLWWLAGSTVLSVLLSIGLTLALLLAINGTLSIGRHRQVRQTASALIAIQSNLEGLKQDLRLMDGRLDSIEGLTGRMDQVEADTRALRLDMQSALQAVAEMQNAVQQLQTSTTELETRVDRLEAFLDGLRRLLAADETAVPQGQ